MAVTPLNIPKLGVSMTEGSSSSGLSTTAPPSRPVDVIYRLETDKVETDVEAPVAGVGHITGDEGEMYDVGAQIGEIDSEVAGQTDEWRQPARRRGRQRRGPGHTRVRWASEKGHVLVDPRLGGRPSTRSPMMLRWISSEPPTMR